MLLYQRNWNGPPDLGLSVSEYLHYTTRPADLQDAKYLLTQTVIRFSERQYKSNDLYWDFFLILCNI